MVTNQQVGKLMKELNTGKTLETAALKADMCIPTARKYLKTGGVMPDSVERNWRTRKDPFSQDWSDMEAYLEMNPGLDANALFSFLQRNYPGRYQDGQLRTFQRRVKNWKIFNGHSKEVFFPQVHHPGKLCESDFTNMNSLGVTIASQPFDHLIYHFVLTYSNWETGSICFSESFESLSDGFQKALSNLGAVPQEHQTDCLTAAVNNLNDPKEFTKRYTTLLGYYGVTSRRTNPSSPNENGDIEQRHYRFKRALDQSLMLRGSRDFESKQEYNLFLQSLFSQLNQGRRESLVEEMAVMKDLQKPPLDTRKCYKVRVGKSSTIRVLHNTYSVDSRLKGQMVDVLAGSTELTIKYGGKLIEIIPRLIGENNHRIEYRHIISSLVRKPGAFKDYKYRDDLFPSSHFRVAYDSIKQCWPERADKEYLRILELAALGSEVAVETAIKDLLSKNQTPSIEKIEHILDQGSHTYNIPLISVASVDLNDYDSLLENEEVC